MIVLGVTRKEAAGRAITPIFTSLCFVKDLRSIPYAGLILKQIFISIKELLLLNSARSDNILNNKLNAISKLCQFEEVENKQKTNTNSLSKKPNHQFEWYYLLNKSK